MGRQKDLELEVAGLIRYDRLLIFDWINSYKNRVGDHSPSHQS